MGRIVTCSPSGSSIGDRNACLLHVDWAVGESASTHRTTSVAQMWMPDRFRPRGRPRAASAPSFSNHLFQRLMVLVEQNRTAVTVAHG